jgi:16S rRNA (cytidine1402-2'-O)-methyltransferase
MGDLSVRAQEVLRTVDFVICEDTRVTAKLMAKLELHKPLRICHEHTDAMKLKGLIDELLMGKSAALVTDAGTPGVNDPGGMLVAAAVKAGIDVRPVPGPNAGVTALSVAGFPADKYSFVGFPPHKKGRETFFAELAEVSSTIVLYESTHRIEKTLSALAQLGRPLVVCRELTKLHETIYRGSADEILAELLATSSKGEFVIVVAPKKWSL